MPGRKSLLCAFGLLALFFAFVSLIDALTNTLPPRWDAVTYVSMAADGILDNDTLIAPFAYRPGAPLLARWIAGVLSLPVTEGFRVLTYLAATAFLGFCFLLARRHFRLAPGPALWITAILGFSASHIKIPLFLNGMADVTAYPVFLGAIWALLARRFALALVVSLLGLGIKEFMVVPAGLLAFSLFKEYGESPGKRWGYPAGVLVLAGMALVLPRLVIPVVRTYQEIDPLNDPASIRQLYLKPLQWDRNINIGYALTGYFLPTWLLLTRDRSRRLWSGLGELRSWLLVYLGLVLLHTLYGGTNIFIFVSYLMGAQIILLAYLLRSGIPRLELGLVLAAIVVYNRIPWLIPDPARDLDAYLDFYGGWAARLPIESAGRILEMLGYGVLIYLSRRWTRKKRTAGVPS